jgi:hypothetical protein
MVVENLSPRASPLVYRRCLRWCFGWCFALACSWAVAACSGTLGGGPDGATGATDDPSTAAAASASGGSRVGGSCWVTELATQLEDPCVLALPAPPNAKTSRDYIYVSGDGLRIPRDASHVAGWDYVDPAATAVEVYGPSCEAIRTGQIQALTITYFCMGLE